MNTNNFWGSQAKIFLLSSLLVLLVLAAFQPALNNGFTSWDDPAYVTSNAQVQQGVTWQNVRWAFTHNVASNWHPLTVLSHMLDCQWFGPQPFGHHLTSLLLHMANTVLLFLVLNAMTGFPWRSFFVAALFGIHPLNVESVAWISERKNVLSTLFWLLTWFAYLKYVRHRSTVRSPQSTVNPALDFRLSTLAYALALLFFSLGLMAKSMLVTLPFTLLLLDYWPLDRRSKIEDGRSEFGVRRWKELVVEKIPFFLIAIVFCFVSIIAQHKAGAMIAVHNLPLSLRIENALVSYVRYLGKFFWPEHLSYFYVFPTWPVLIVLATVLLLTIISIFAWVRRTKAPWLLVGWLWFLGTLVPVIGLVQVGEQAMADRYAYIPMIGVSLLVVWGISECLSRRPMIILLAGFALLAGITITRQQTTCWKNSESLYRHAIAVDPNNWAAYGGLGRTLRGQGRLDEAIEQYQKAIALLPTDPDIHNNLGTALFAKGQVADATAQFEQAVRLRPDLAISHLNLGTAYCEQGRISEGTAEFKEALRLDPGNPSAQHNLDIIQGQKNTAQPAN